MSPERKTPWKDGTGWKLWRSCHCQTDRTEDKICLAFLWPVSLSSHVFLLFYHYVCLLSPLNKEDHYQYFLLTVKGGNVPTAWGGHWLSDKSVKILISLFICFPMQITKKVRQFPFFFINNPPFLTAWQYAVLTTEVSVFQFVWLSAPSARIASPLFD